MEPARPADPRPESTGGGMDGQSRCVGGSHSPGASRRRGRSLRGGPTADRGGDPGVPIGGVRRLHCSRCRELAAPSGAGSDALGHLGRGRRPWEPPIDASVPLRDDRSTGCAARVGPPAPAPAAEPNRGFCDEPLADDAGARGARADVVHPRRWGRSLADVARCRLLCGVVFRAARLRVAYRSRSRTAS